MSHTDDRFGLSVIAGAMLLVMSVCGPVRAMQDATETQPAELPVIWTTATSLAPGLGFWVRPGDVGQTSPLGETSRYKTSVIGSGKLTWVANFPRAGTYQVWVRHFGFRGSVLVNEELVIGGGDGPAAGGGYVWSRLGQATVEEGPAHVDIVLEQAALDAVLLSLDRDFDPATAKLPEPVKDPVLRAPRTYGNDSHLADAAGTVGLVAGRMDDPYEEHCNDAVPGADEVLETLHLWGSPNQFVTGTFMIRALEDAHEVEIDLPRLEGPQIRLGRYFLELTVAQLRERPIAAYSEHTALRGNGLLPDLLLHDDRTGFPPTGRQGQRGGGRCISSIPAHESRQIWLTVEVPEYCPPGQLAGTIDVRVKGDTERKLSIPVTVEVLPIDLNPVEGYYGAFYRSYVNPRRTAAIPAEQFLSELRFHVRYGINAVTLYDGSVMLPYAREAGLTQPPVSMVPRTPSFEWREMQHQLAMARAMGFPDLYFYGVDEPHTEEAIKSARGAGQGALKAGIHAQESFMGPGDYEKLKDVINRPVMMLYNFHLRGTDNELVQYASEKGYQPISYWFSNASYPIRDRALSGLYNTACGYHGTAPWATQDYSPRATTSYFYYYPDETGQPIPTIRFEAFRHGIDDVRYLQALDRAILATEKRLELQPQDAAPRQELEAARLVRKNRFEEIRGGYVRYVDSVNAQALEAGRREMAEAIMSMSAGQAR